VRTNKGVNYIIIIDHLLTVSCCDCFLLSETFEMCFLYSLLNV